MAGIDDPGRARARLLQTIYGYTSTAVLHAAALLGVADLLEAGERGFEELAAETQPTRILCIDCCGRWRRWG